MHNNNVTTSTLYDTKEATSYVAMMTALYESNDDTMAIPAITMTTYYDTITKSNVTVTLVTTSYKLDHEEITTAVTMKKENCFAQFCKISCQLKQITSILKLYF